MPQKCELTFKESVMARNKDFPTINARILLEEKFLPNIRYFMVEDEATKEALVFDYQGGGEFAESWVKDGKLVDTELDNQEINTFIECYFPMNKGGDYEVLSNMEHPEWDKYTVKETGFTIYTYGDVTLKSRLLNLGNTIWI